MQNEILKYLSFAHYLADNAGDIILRYYKSKKIKIFYKNNNKKREIYTNTDLIVEKNIINLIKRHYPQHNVIGEETGKIKSKSNFTWIIDPIDGTKAFSLGIPVFGVLIALKYKSKIILGLVDQPILKERFWNNSKFSFLNNKKIKTSACKSIQNAAVACTDPNMFNNFEELNRLLFKKFNFIRWGTDVLGYLRCAEGKLDVVIERDLNLWDVAAVDPIIKKSGGMITTWDGKEIGTNDTVLASSNRSLHHLIVNKLQKFI
ncbi:MAG: hypothetical protein CMP24_07180 [Rickettsiales bacterium]|nr:hypothetical protein [Rickettsiales bacterium]|tara:strand:+ start:82 stop:864 length:783 start_codon:yes stop_codon:yes gene_type:complete